MKITVILNKNDCIYEIFKIHNSYFIMWKRIDSFPQMFVSIENAFNNKLEKS